MRSKNISILAFFLLFLMFLPRPAVAGDEIPAEVIKAAQEGLQILVKKSLASRLPRFGFTSKQEVDDAVVGQGFQSAYVDSSKFSDPTIGSSTQLRDFLVKMNNWRFLIMTHGKSAALLTVFQVNGKWTPADLGGATPAENLNQVLLEWPASSGYHYRIIHAYEGRADFVELSTSDGALGLIPLTSARQAMKEQIIDFDPLDIRKESDIVKKIKEDKKKTLNKNHD